ncbi:MAG: hypothetical protein ABR506_09450 [Candidatus Krumholzibacteriia bacterium]
MPHLLRTLASGWRQLWARESLPPVPPADGCGRPPNSLLHRLLARETLPERADAARPSPTFSRRLLARESLPAAPRRPAEPDPE